MEQEKVYSKALSRILLIIVLRHVWYYILSEFQVWLRFLKCLDIWHLTSGLCACAKIVCLDDLLLIRWPDLKCQMSRHFVSLNNTWNSLFSEFCPCPFHKRLWRRKRWQSLSARLMLILSRKRRSSGHYLTILEVTGVGKIRKKWKLIWKRVHQHYCFIIPIDTIGAVWFVLLPMELRTWLSKIPLVWLSIVSLMRLLKAHWNLIL